MRVTHPGRFVATSKEPFAASAEGKLLRGRFRGFHLFRRFQLFDFEHFKSEYGEQYQAALDKAKEDYKKFYAEMGNQTLDLDKYSESIEHRAKEYCRDWLKEAQAELKG